MQAGGKTRVLTLRTSAALVVLPLTTAPILERGGAMYIERKPGLARAPGCHLPEETSLQGPMGLILLEGYRFLLQLAA